MSISVIPRLSELRKKPEVPAGTEPNGAVPYGPTGPNGLPNGKPADGSLSHRYPPPPLPLSLPSLPSSSFPSLILSFPPPPQLILV